MSGGLGRATRTLIGCYPIVVAMPAVNPDILVWARKTAGLTLEDAVMKVGIQDARGVAAIDRLTALERGDEKPSRRVLVNMAQHYRRPLLAFYLSAPPRRDDRGPDFRTLPGARSPETDALVNALVRNLRSRQNMVRAALEAEDEAEPPGFVGALMSNGIGGTGTESLRRILRHRAEAARLSQRASRAMAQVLGDDVNAASCAPTASLAQPSSGARQISGCNGGSFALGSARGHARRRAVPTTTPCAGIGLGKACSGSPIAWWIPERFPRPRLPGSWASSPRRSAKCFVLQGCDRETVALPARRQRSH